MPAFTQVHSVSAFRGSVRALREVVGRMRATPLPGIEPEHPASSQRQHTRLEPTDTRHSPFARLRVDTPAQHGRLKLLPTAEVRAEHGEATECTHYAGSSRTRAGFQETHPKQNKQCGFIAYTDFLQMKLAYNFAEQKPFYCGTDMKWRVTAYVHRR
jgi:hypothetical protein